MVQDCQREGQDFKSNINKAVNNVLEGWSLHFDFFICVAGNFASRHLITILFRLYLALENSILQRPLNLWVIIKTVLCKEIMPNSC